MLPFFVTIGERKGETDGQREDIYAKIDAAERIVMQVELRRLPPRRATTPPSYHPHLPPPTPATTHTEVGEARQAGEAGKTGETGEAGRQAMPHAQDAQGTRHEAGHHTQAVRVCTYRIHAYVPVLDTTNGGMVD